ncbi:hypothetical protein RKE29_09225 [Streptomyces sp. B1866]|uniref:hypothetical protein n=1 Tax=Streptomyces sp. B1866 TaxID=3075431 RepID=UPI0028917390|nr:hypothetical protein [Streptomyces sp. B1866]MDT3396821.1 hypothetical protein [Streptomyces sp. B1866]
MNPWHLFRRRIHPRRDDSPLPQPHRAPTSYLERLLFPTDTPPRRARRRPDPDDPPS